MALKGKPIAIGTSDTTIYTCPATTEASIHGLVFANNTGSSVTITLKVYIQSTASTTTVATGITVAANSTYTWPKPIDVNAGDYVQAAASTGSAIVCLYSVYEGSATAAAIGFTPRGAWSSGANYAVNDVVSYSGSSYLAIQANSSFQPNTSTAQWLLLASKGDTGAAGTGSGDVTGPSSSVDSELALFDSTTGKVIKRASLTGIVKATSGVASAATAGTDYQAAISATGILKGAGGGSVSGATAGTDYLAPAAIGATVQAYDADLAAIAALSGTSGLLKKTAADTWTLDTSAYLTTVTKSDVGLGNVENTALTTWAGSTNITTLGTVTTGSFPVANVSGLGSGVGTFLATPSSANLASAVTDETGSGALVFGTSPTLTTPTATGLRETRVAMPANDINLSAGNVFTKTISGATTLTVSNIPASGTLAAFILELTNPASNVTFWATIKWAGGTAPTPTTTGRDVFGFWTHDNGTTWNGVMIAKDIK